MKVTMAGYQAISILHGGPNTQLRETAQHLQRFGVRAELFDPWGPLNPGTCDLFHLFAANIGTYHLAREIHLLGIPMVVSPVVYSLHSPFLVRASLAATRLAQSTVQGVWSDYGLTADICGWADRVLPNTEAEASLLVDGLGVPRDKITVVPNGVDERFLRATPSAFIKKYGVRDFILNVGHTGHTRKNVLRLIQALAGIDHPAVIIGRIVKGPYGDACVREAAKHKHILLVDGLEHASPLLASAYAACDVFVLPSLFETPGIAALEAALAGAKVVITEHGGTREYFEHMASYVDPTSVDSIREGVMTALAAKKDPALRQHIRDRFLWKHVAGRTAAAYHQVLR